MHVDHYGAVVNFTMPSCSRVLTVSWWRHQMETFSAWLAISAGNSPVPGEFPTQRPVTRSFDVYFDLRLNKRFCKQSWGWWFETLLCPLWRHNNVRSIVAHNDIHGICKRLVYCSTSQQECTCLFRHYCGLIKVRVTGFLKHHSIDTVGFCQCVRSKENMGK